MPQTDAERYERLLLQEASLREVIEAISSELDLRSLLTRIAESACHLLEADNGAIGLVDEVQGVVRIEATYRMPDDELGSEARPGKGLMGQVMESRGPIIFRSYGDVKDPTRTDLHDNAVIGVPIFWRDRVIGVFGIGSEPPRQFEDADADILSRFAKHAAIAIENARLFDRAQAALGEMQLLYETSARLGVALHPEDIAGAYLEQVATKGKYGCTILEYLFDDDDRRTGVLVRGKWNRRDGTVIGNWRYSYSRDQLDDQLDAGETVMVDDVEIDPRVTEELRDLQRRDGNPAIAMIPLLASGRRTGLVVLTSEKAHHWDERELRPYQATAAYLAIALEHRHEQLNLMQAEQQVAVLEDRQRLAHELHDSVTQLLTGINFIAQATPAAMKRDPAEGEKRLEQLSELSRRALGEMRALLAELAPRESQSSQASSTQAGLVELIGQHLGSLDTDGPQLSFSHDSYREQPEPIEHALYRMVQEAVNNALKYAEASQISIHLTSTDSEVVLVIADNGRGLVESASSTKTDSSGLGIPGMRKRALDLQGTFRIHSKPGEGTSIEVRLPV